MEWLLEEKSISARVQTESGVEIVFHLMDNNVAYANRVTNGSATKASEFPIASDNGFSHRGDVNWYVKTKIAVTKCINTIAVMQMI